MTEPKIRIRNDYDVPQLANTLVEVYALDGYPVEGVDDPEAWLRHPQAVLSWVAEVNGEPVGQVTLASASLADDAARLWQQQTGGDLANLVIPVRLFVAPDQRNIGAGRLLMEAVAHYAREHNLTLAFDVMEKDRAAIRLYEKMGAQRLGAITHHHSGDRAEPAVVYVYDPT